MQQFRQAFDFYINSSIHVSFSVVALALLTGSTLNISVSLNVLAFLFFSTVTGYNFVKYAEIAGLHHRSLARSLKNIQIFSAVCGIGLVICVVQLRWESIVCLGFFWVLTLLYAVPFLSKNRNLRTIAGIKIYVIALVWSGVIVLIPVLENGLVPYWDVWILFVQRFLFVLALMIPFEIRDVSFDSQSLKTLPQVVGIKKAKIIGVIWLLLCFCLEYFKDNFSIIIVMSSALISLVILVCILKSQKRTFYNDYFASFWVEGIPILWLWIFLSINYLFH